MIGNKNQNVSSQAQQQFTPNTIMIESKDNIIYLPGYLVISIRNFRSLMLQQLSAQVYLTMQLAINVTDLHKQTINQLNNLVLNFPSEGNISMDKKKNKNINMQQEIKHIQIDSKKYKLKIFKIKKFFQLSVHPYIRLTPFELVDLILSINIKTMTIKKQNTEGKDIKYQIKINLFYQSISSNQIQKIINYNSDGILGNYDLAQAKLCVQYTNNAQEKTLIQLGKYWNLQKIFRYFKNKIRSYYKKIPNSTIDTSLKKSKQQSKIKNFQYAHFHIPLYKFPFVSLCTIFLPLVFLGIINLSIFFQSPSLADRVGNIATLMIAFIGMITVIRNQISPTPSITIVQILVYLQISTTLLCLIQSLMTKNDQTLNTISTQIFFIISCMITSLVIILPIAMMIVHHVYLQKTYNLEVDEQLQQDFSGFITDRNSKTEAGKYFYKYKDQLLYATNKQGEQEKNYQFNKRLEEIQHLFTNQKQ